MEGLLSDQEIGLWNKHFFQTIQVLDVPHRVTRGLVWLQPSTAESSRLIQGGQEQSLHFQEIVSEVVELAKVSEGFKMKLEIGGASDKGGKSSQDSLPLRS